MRNERIGAFKKYGFVFFILLLISVWPVKAQSLYKNALLSELALRLSSFHVTADSPGEYWVTEVCAGRPIVIHRDRNQKIDHIGVKLFNRAIVEKHPSPIYYFVERYLLEILLLDDEEDIKGKLKRERVTISSELYELLSYKQGVRNILGDASLGTSVYVTCNNNRYLMSCIKDKNIVLSLEFPVCYELITGNTKLEAENSLYPSLLFYKPDKHFMADVPKDLVVPHGNMLTCNDDYYATEQMISTSYYRKQKNDTLVVFASDYIMESTYNLFNAYVDQSVNVEITQSLYGNKSNTFTYSLPVFMHFLRSQGCGVYTAIQTMDDDRISGAVMAVNMELGYQHLMLFTFDRTLFEHPDKKVVKVKMYSYIPIHNVSSLFYENKLK